MDDFGSVVLHFFIATDGELRCRVTDIHSRRTWVVPAGRQVHDLIHAEQHDRQREEASHAE